MQLIIKDGFIFASHENSQEVAHLYPGYECVKWDEPIKFLPLDEGSTPDPRSEKQKQDNYIDKRRVAYPSVQTQLDMIYHDTVNGTTLWVGAITAVKTTHPKPIKVDK